MRYIAMLAMQDLDGSVGPIPVQKKRTNKHAPLDDRWDDQRSTSTLHCDLCEIEQPSMIDFVPRAPGGGETTRISRKSWNRFSYAPYSNRDQTKQPTVNGRKKRQGDRDPSVVGGGCNNLCRTPRSLECFCFSDL
jgi:hypothetical protein